MSAGASPDAELSAVANRVEELSTRVADLAQRLDRDGDTEAAASLYEVERALGIANRNLDRARHSL